MAYTTPLKVFRSMNRIEEAEETFTSVSDGDTFELANNYIIKDTETVTVDGNTQSDSDYTVNFDENTIDYNGSDTGTATIEYAAGPYTNSAVQSSIDAVTEHIDDYTNSTYGGLVTVTDEIYDGGRHKVYPFVNRPVQSVSKVAVNNPTDAQGNPNYETLTEGLGEDYTDYKDLGIRFNDEGESPDNQPKELQVTYDYGYADVPSDLKRAATEMVVDDLVNGTVSGAMVDGRDNFDPQTVDVMVNSYQEVLDRYRIERYENMVNLAEHGTTS